MSILTGSPPASSSDATAICSSCIGYASMLWTFLPAVPNMTIQYSTPPRIEAAEPIIRYSLSVFRDYHPDPRDVDHLTLGFLAVAIQHQAGKAAEADVLFRTALKMPLHRLGCKKFSCMEQDTELWLRANYTRLLRRLGKDDEADHQEVLMM